jgi:hypothetical protein
MFTLALASALSAAVAGAQTATGNLRGYVTSGGGSAGAAVPDAQVVARALDNNAQRGTVTNASGFYYMGGLRPGRYEVSARRVGFSPTTRTITLQIGQTLDLNLPLAETAVTLSAVQVTAAPAGTTTRTSEVGTNVSREQISDLPNFERNVLDLAKLVPGITPSNVNSTDKTFAAGGQPPEAINVFVDGATYKNDVLRGGVAGQDASKGNPFPQGAIQEFRVLTQNYKAEYQKASSAIIVATTRSGTNEVEADVFGYGVGRGYAARDAYNVLKGNTGRPEYKRLQAGGSFGAPIQRDKLFFFGTYELNFRDEPSYVTLGPDAARAPAGLNPSQYTGQFVQQFREHLGLAKLTWNQSTKSTVDASLNVRHDADFRGFGGQTAFTAAENLAVQVYTGVANWKYAGDRWLNEAQVNLQNMTWNPTPRDPNTVGRNYFGIIRIGGKDTEQDFKQNRLSLRNDVTRGGVQFGGDHVFKGGATVDFLNYTGTKYTLTNPVFNYRSDESWSRPFQAQFGFGDPTIKRDNIQFGGYVQDDWSVGRKLVLNLGLRWDAETNGINNTYVTPKPLADSLRGPLASQFYVEVPQTSGPAKRVNVVQQLGGIDRYISNGRSSRPIYKKAFQPRVGFSYDLMGDGRTVVFGGGGLYYDRNYWNTLFDEQYRRQFRVLTVNFSDTCNNAPGCTKWDPKYLDPAQLRTLSGTSGVPEVFLVANDLKPPRTTQMSAGLRQQIGSVKATLSYNGLRGRNLMNFVRATPWGGLGPNYAQAFVSDDRVKTWYDAMQFQLERPLTEASRIGGSVAYTLAKSIEQGQSQDIFWYFDDRYPTVSDLYKRRAPGDQRHTVVGNVITRLPYDIRLSGIVTLGSGIAVNATDASQGWDIVRQRTYVYSLPTRAFLGIGHVFANQNLDARVEKGFRVVSGQRVAVSLDLFNALNSANYGCYETTIVPTADQNADWRRQYGQPKCAALGRRLQIGLRYGVRPDVGASSGSRTSSGQ